MSFSRRNALNFDLDLMKGKVYPYNNQLTKTTHQYKLVEVSFEIRKTTNKPNRTSIIHTGGRLTLSRSKTHCGFHNATSKSAMSRKGFIYGFLPRK